MSTVSETQTPYSLFTPYDIFLLRAGNHYQLHTKFGAHKAACHGREGTYFAVWAPNARYVSLVGDFNDWEKGTHPLTLRQDGSGIWESFFEGIGTGTLYKYFIVSTNGYEVEKADPYAFMSQSPPETASVVWHPEYTWSDAAWKEKQIGQNPLKNPIAIYELHLGSWRRVPHENSRFLTYRELAAELPAYLSFMGFTHVEFMPVMEHPFYGSWGYQITGYYSPSSRFGTPDDFMHLINQLHRHGIAVILDWVPSHFPTDEHGLGYFDGTHLYEHEDSRKGFHPDWKSFIFNYGRDEVRSFLASNAMYYLEVFHVDGLRMDAVTSMLKLDYSRSEGEWIPNEFGGNDNLEAIRFIRELNDAVHTKHPGKLIIAEESTAYTGVTHFTASGGLGFDMKWMMGWMHDTLDFFKFDPIYRSYHLDKLTLNIYYAFSEKFTLPLSHDEVVYGKRSLIGKMPGDEWQRFANLRLLLGYMYGHPGAKLLFMGSEFGQSGEWRHDYSLDWNEADQSYPRGVQLLVKDLNELYQHEASLFQRSFEPEGFEWVDFSDRQNCVISWLRKGFNEQDNLLFIANFTPLVWENYRIGVGRTGYYTEVFNSDAFKYGGSGVANTGKKETYPVALHGRTHSISITLPPLGLNVFKWSEPFSLQNTAAFGS